MKIYALHGFLGSVNDWTELPLPLSGELFKPVDLYDKRFPTPSEGMWAWARNFNEELSSEREKVLLGYSLGGRLALHTLIDAPEQWRGGIIISANPGLHSAEKRRERLLNDKKWAERFRFENWEKIMEAWNSQEPLKNTFVFQRHEDDYARPSLSETLHHWSLGRRDDLLENLKNIKIPLLWIAGENDKAYVAILKKVQNTCPHIQTAIIPNSGHRCLWEKPQEALAEIKRFLSPLKVS